MRKYLLEVYCFAPQTSIKNKNRLSLRVKIGKTMCRTKKIFWFYLDSLIKKKSIKYDVNLSMKDVPDMKQGLVTYYKYGMKVYMR